MKTTCKFERYSFNQQGDIELTVTIDKRYMQQVDKFANEHDDKYHEIKINSRVTQRTEKQNNAVWKLIREINKVEHGESNSDLTNELYVNMIKFAGIKVEFYESVEEAKEYLEQAFRYVESVDKRVSSKGVNTCVFACYKGLSSFNKEENTQFIKVLLDYSGKLGLGVTLESEYLRGLLK